MTSFEPILAALELPPGCRVDRRVPKTMLVEHGAPTAADRRRLEEGVAELHWLAALKPATVGVPEFRDDTREYLEIAVLRLVLRPEVKTAGRLLELVHRAIPYPVLLLAEQPDGASLSAAHKRWAQNEAGKTVLDGEVLVAEPGMGSHGDALRAALPLARQPRATLHALYQGWIGAILAWQVAQATGTYAAEGTAEYADRCREGLRECARLEDEIARLRAAAARERQMARLVDLNLELKRAEARLAETKARL